jgi:hypothetical protein
MVLARKDLFIRLALPDAKRKYDIVDLRSFIWKTWDGSGIKELRSALGYDSLDVIR